MRIVFLLEVMHGAPDEPMGVELAAESSQFAARAVAQNRLCHADGAAKSGHDASDGGDLHLRRRITNQVNVTTTYATLHRNPLAIHGNLGALPFEGFHPFLFEKAREPFRGVGAF